MAIALSVTETQIQIALQTFLNSILPAGVPVIEGQDNRVSEPPEGDFVVMTPMMRSRLSTNVDTYSDNLFVGAIVGATLTISSVTRGGIAIGNPVFGVGVAIGTSVTAFGSGTGGAGTYTVAPSQTVSPGVIACGLASFLQASKVTVQLDVHGPAASDNAQTIATMMRDDYAVQSFLSSGFDVVPLYADDPKQVPFVNAEQQYETRYVIDAVLQANQVVTGVPQQFAGQISVSLTAANELPAS